LICDLDSEGSGNITFEQFLHLNTRRLVPDDSRENLKSIFTLFDDEKSGFITVKSLRRKAR
jgi:Ca2+-binding EF-hand superfamily protein